MNAPENNKKATSNNEFVTLKIIYITIVSIALLIPAIFIGILIIEREARRDSVVREINGKWGNSQTITGPFITVPYKTFYDSEDKTKLDINYLHILPEALNVSGDMKPEVRYRSLFEAVLYNARLNISGNFKIPQAGQLDIDPANILWDKANLSIGISDLQGVRDKIVVKFNNATYNANPGLSTNDLAFSGVSALINPLSANETNDFSFDLNLNGSQRISFIPVGESNQVRLSSKWPSPSFTGAFLPSKRSVDKDGFSASWKVLYLNRNYPQFWLGNQYKVDSSAFGLKMILTANIYQKSMRLVKYVILFIVFTFSALFLAEILNKRRVHPIQYLLVGFAILLFYTLLLSLSEHIYFNYAYLISAAAVTVMISGYSMAIIKSSRFALTIFGILTVLYLYLFVILQLADYALIMGSIGLFIILAVVMYVTRKIDWYELDSRQIAGETPA